MSQTLNFESVYEHLKELMNGYESRLHCLHDTPKNYYLETTYIMKNKKPLFFGAVQIKKNYVSYHLMPVYVFPELLEDLSPELKQRMQGKSCFNFRKVDGVLFDELGALTARAFGLYRKHGYV